MKRRFVTRRSPIHGRGVYAAVDLRAGERLLEYRGRRITRAAAARRDAGLTRRGHTFLFTLNDRYAIDGAAGGNSARWINHSCDPNCHAEVHVDIDGDARRDRVYVYATRPIRAGEELTFDYDIKLAVSHTPQLERTWACRCGSARCRGTMLAK